MTTYHQPSLLPLAWQSRQPISEISRVLLDPQADAAERDFADAFRIALGAATDPLQFSHDGAFHDLAESDDIGIFVREDDWHAYAEERLYEAHPQARELPVVALDVRGWADEVLVRHGRFLPIVVADTTYYAEVFP